MGLIGLLKNRRADAVILPVLMLGILIPFAAVSFSIAFPAISSELGLSAIHMTWMPTAYLIAGAVAGLPVGRVARRIGNRNAMITGIASYAVAAGAVALAGDFQLLVLGFFVMGTGSSMITVTGQSLLYAVCDAEERETSYAALITAISIGTLAGDFLGGAVIHFLSWRWLFGINAVLGATCLLPLLGSAQPGDGDRSERGFDLLGTLLYSLFIVAFLLGFSHFPSESSGFLIPFSLVMLATFVWVETRAPKPIIRIALFRESRGFRFSSLSTTLRMYSTYGVWFLLSFYLQHITGLTPAETGLILGTTAVVTACTSSLSTILSRRTGDRAAIGLGLLFNTAGLLLLTLLGQDLSLGILLVSMVLLGLATALSGAPSTSLMFRSVPDEHRGMASATMNLAQKMGSSLSMGTLMLLFSLLLGSVQFSDLSPASFLSCMHLTFLVFAALSAGSWLYAMLPESRLAQNGSDPGGMDRQSGGR
jgi:MFS family permease